jgi:hypothetical protein
MTSAGQFPLLGGLLASTRGVGREPRERADARAEIDAGARAEAAVADARTDLARFLVGGFLDLRPALGRGLHDPATSAAGLLVAEVAALEE